VVPYGAERTEEKNIRGRKKRDTVDNVEKNQGSMSAASSLDVPCEASVKFKITEEEGGGGKVVTGDEQILAGRWGRKRIRLRV